MLEFYDILKSWGPLVTGRRLPLPGLANSKITDSCPVSVPFTRKPVNPEPIYLTIHFIRLTYTRLLSTCQGHSRARYQTTKDSFYASWPVETSQLETCLTSPVSSQQNCKRLLTTFPSASYASWSNLVFFYVASECCSIFLVSREL